MGGQRIDDHAAWMGSRGKHTVLPDGAKTKHVRSTEGIGSVANYEDTNDKIVEQQEISNRKVKGHPRKDMFRN